MPNDIANNMADTIHQLEKKLKDLREENKVLISECDRLIKEKGELLKKSEWIAEYKRLLKVAVEDINATEACDTCEYYPVINGDACQKNDCYKWHYADETLKLIEGRKLHFMGGKNEKESNNE